MAYKTINNVFILSLRENCHADIQGFYVQTALSIWNGDHIISLKEFTESEMGRGLYEGSMITIFAFESWLPESERNGASDWLALDYKEFEALLVSFFVWGIEQLESTNTEMQAQIVGYSNFKSFPTKLTIQAVQNAMQKNGKAFYKQY